jgi:hypothetical protein
MQQEIIKAKVKFVTSANPYTRDKEVTAVLTDHPYNRALTTCYSHIGQHDCCDNTWVKAQRESTEEEYKDLLAELKSIGYDVTIVK